VPCEVQAEADALPSTSTAVVAASATLRTVMRAPTALARDASHTLAGETANE
jgi:hypothetical protein